MQNFEGFVKKKNKQVLTPRRSRVLIRLEIGGTVEVKVRRERRTIEIFLDVKFYKVKVSFFCDGVCFLFQGLLERGAVAKRGPGASYTVKSLGARDRAGPPNLLVWGLLVDDIGPIRRKVEGQDTL